MSTPNSPQNSEETVTFPKETTGRTSQISGICSEKSGKASERNDIPVLEVRDLCHRYPHLDSNTLDKINLKVFKGERVAVLGANGAGKSTLFKHLNGILKPLSGEVLIKGEKMTKKNIRTCRKTVGIVFQDPDDQVLAPSVEEDIAFGPINMGLSRNEVERRVKEALEMVGLTGFEERAPHHLSGGQKKLVAIAGILAMRPEIIVLDEPTAGLDPLSSARVLELIMKMNRELGITLLLSTHNVDVVPYFAERVFVLHHGRLEADGSPYEIFSDPELLRKAHLRLPRVAEVFEMLQQKGLNVNIQITAEAARDEILRLVSSGQQKRIE
ncbi:MULTISPECIES: ATP-binding cassette domain-containing protein [Methanosarcina]|uniref:ABC transporter ATP-binding protein n=3 Tax=Methanosarcina barkeri TaxID=2208 RepID=A0A0E3QYW8_METBA|nr:MULTISPECIES: ATP-binding cassette domain-containing protein [Methanosarcina]AKB56124.1 ATPase component NikO of energizing module of nickel ECF transporter [Methanosarcina barkeri MS]AKB59601.1 ATPase component NikO of energizing module of nickel ECF transporter [Methanosarcina barkeri 227]AKJ40265.1 cobalt ABC transporter ATP-binding protein CbiO5 [Methanosarcina barkeri CM1]OED12487.1 ATP-binding protein [Methanosarcina sp. A14]